MTTSQLLKIRIPIPPATQPLYDVLIKSGEDTVNTNYMMMNAGNMSDDDCTK